MKRAFYLFVIAVLVFSCETEIPLVEVKQEYKDPYELVNEGVDVRLRPFLGWYEGSGTGKIFNFYCDTNSEPKVIVSANRDSPSAYAIPVILKPNTDYYWYCSATSDYEYSTGSANSDIYHFKTIDIAKLYKRHWHYSMLLRQEKYENRIPAQHELLRLDRFSDEFYGQVWSFDATQDSVKNVEYIGMYSNTVYPTEGVFSFSFDTIKIANKTYEFVNFGRHDNKSIELVLKVPGADYVIIYTSREPIE